MQPVYPKIINRIKYTQHIKTFLLKNSNTAVDENIYEYLNQGLKSLNTLALATKPYLDTQSSEKDYLTQVYKHVYNNQLNEINIDLLSNKFADEFQNMFDIPVIHKADRNNIVKCFTNIIKLTRFVTPIFNKLDEEHQQEFFDTYIMTAYNMDKELSENANLITNIIQGHNHKSIKTIINRSNIPGCPKEKQEAFINLETKIEEWENILLSATPNKEVGHVLPQDDIRGFLYNIADGYMKMYQLENTIYGSTNENLTPKMFDNLYQRLMIDRPFDNWLDFVDIKDDIREWLEQYQLPIDNKLSDNCASSIKDGLLAQFILINSVQNGNSLRKDFANEIGNTVNDVVHVTINPIQTNATINGYQAQAIDFDLEK